MIELTIPIAPISLNRILRSHWAIRKKIKEQWMQELKVASQGLQRATLFAWQTQRKKLSVDIEIYHSRLFDMDNLWGSTKVIADALVSLEWAHDDRPEFMERQVRQFKSKRTEQKTIVRIGRA